MTLSTVNVRTKDFEWKTDFSVSTNKGWIVELANGKVDDTANGWFIGRPIDDIWQYKYDRLWQNTDDDLRMLALYDANGISMKPGMAMIEDQPLVEVAPGTAGAKTTQITWTDTQGVEHTETVTYEDNGFGTINDDDKKHIGQWSPKVNAGFTTTFTYKNWELSAFFYGRFGGKYYGLLQTLGRRVETDLWSPTNPGGKYPIQVNGGTYTLGDGTETNLWRIVYTSGNGTVVLNDGTFTRNVNNDYAFFGANGTGSITVNGGIYKDLVHDYIRVDGDMFTVINGGTFDGGFVGEMVQFGSISTPEVFLAFAKTVNLGNSFAEQTITLAADIDLEGVEWTPIGINSENYFRGTFDGANNTISNLTVEGGADYVGLFGYVDTAVIKNFTLENVNVSGGSWVAAAVGDLYRGTAENIKVKNAVLSGNHFAGAITGYTYGTVSECDVDGLEIDVTPNASGDSYDNGDKVGGIAGWMGSGTIDGCSVKNATISAFRDLGGIVGNVQRDGDAPVVTNNVAENITLSYTSAPGSMVGNNINGNMGAIIGRYASDVAEMTISGNTVTNVTITATPETAQSVLDNLFGGETVVFAAGEYGDLELGQSRTVSTATSNTDPATEIAISDLENAGVYRYGRTVEDVTFVGSDGAVFTGKFLIRSGHIYDSNISDDITYTDPVRGVELNGTATSYFSYMYVDGITFSGMNFEGVEGIIDGRFYIDGAYLKNVTIENCTFTAPDYSDGGTQPASGQTAINLMTDLMNVYENITIEGNEIYNYFQGVYVQNGNGMTVRKNTISGTVHNAIAVQSGGNAGASDPDADYFTGVIIISDNIISFNKAD